MEGRNSFLSLAESRKGQDDAVADEWTHFYDHEGIVVWIAERLGPGQTRNLGESFHSVTPNPVTILPKTGVHPSDLVRHSNAVSIVRVSKV